MTFFFRTSFLFARVELLVMIRSLHSSLSTLTTMVQLILVVCTFRIIRREQFYHYLFHVLLVDLDCGEAEHS